MQHLLTWATVLQLAVSRRQSGMLQLGSAAERQGCLDFARQFLGSAGLCQGLATAEGSSRPWHRQLHLLAKLRSKDLEELPAMQILALPRADHKETVALAKGYPAPCQGQRVKMDLRPLARLQ